MPRPGVIKPRAPLVRDAVRIEFAAQDGEIADAQVVKMAKFILSFMTETERVSLSSRGKIEGYDPPVERFREAAEAFITKFELGDMLAVYDEREEEPPPEPGEDPHNQADDSAGSQRASSTSNEDIAEQRLEQQTTEDDPSAGSQQENESDEEETEGEQGQQELADTAHPEGLARKRKVSPSFQALRSPSAHRYTTKERIPDSPDSPPDWGGFGGEKDSSEADSTEDHILDKGKGKQILLPRSPTAALAAEREESAREREIRATHRVMPSEPISASALISALESQLSEQLTQRDNRLVTTPAISHRRSPSISSSSPSIDRHRRFSVDELGSPGFKPRPAPAREHGPRYQAESDIELRDAPPVHRTIISSPNDIKVEDAPLPITHHHIPGSWTPSRTIHFGEFKTEIPSPRRQAADNEIDLPDAPEEAQPSNEIDLPDAPGGQHRTEEEQLFYSEGVQPRVSLPPTPVDRGNNPVRHSFTPTYPPPATYGSFLPKSLLNVGSYVTTKVGRYCHKSTQTDDEMTARKIDALEDMLKQMMLANEKRDAAMDILLARIAPQASQPADTEQERKRAIFEQLEEERLQKLSALEAELKDKYEAAGFAYDQTSPSEHQAHSSAPEAGRQEPRAEHVKVSQIGLVQPLPAHAEWTGQAHQDGDNSTYVSFKAWLDHLQAVLEQKDTRQWKSAVLDCAALSCLRGRALDWWNACSPSQQWNLRHDFTLEQWRNLGKPLFRNQTLTRKEARDRKRQHGETLSDYAWRKLAMLNEAYGRERPVLDVISDIKEGMSIADQEKIITDLQKSPSMSRFLEELARLDSIRGPMFKEAMNSGKQRYNAQQDRSDTRNKAPYSTPAPKKAPLSATYDPKQLAFRQNPLTPSAAKQWSYVFPNGRTIFLSSPCSHCGAKHFNFECKKRDAARAAMQFGDGWDEGGDDDSDEGEDFMEEACAAYTCVQPSAWAYYADPRKQETPRQSTRNNAGPWDETTGLSGN
jgi:hypothetical protein